MDESCDLLQLCDKESSRLPLEVEGRDVHRVLPPHQDCRKLGKTLPAGDGSVDEVLEEAHHRDLAVVWTLRPLSVEVFVADTEHSGSHLDLILHPFTRALDTGGVMAA